MRSLLEQTSLKVHTTASGQIWMAPGDGAPQRCEAQLPAQWALQAVAQRASVVRLLGTQRNAPLIVALYERHKAGQLGPVELGTPQLLQDTDDDPAATLLCMRSRLDNVPASLGGWHAMTALDYATYRLCDLAAHDAQHPLVRRLGFIAGLNAGAVEDVLFEIRDPRWFVAPQRPNCIGKLGVYLGLSPHIAERAVATAGDGNVRVQRFRSVTGAWFAYDNAPAAEPGGFLLRDYWRRRHVDGKSHAAALLRTSQRFLIMLRLLWLDLAKPAHIGDPFFSPGSFFADAEELAWFTSWSRRDAHG